MSDDATRILALEGRLDDAQKLQMAHDLLIRALLAQLALSDRRAFEQIGNSLTGQKFLREGGGGGELPREVVQEIAATLGEIARTVAPRS